MVLFFLGCLWTSEKRFGDTGTPESRVLYHSVLNQPRDLLAMPGRLFVTSGDNRLRVFDVSQRDAPILSDSIELESEPKAIFNYGDKLFLASILSLELRNLNTLAAVQEWTAIAPIIDATWRPGGTSLLVALNTTPPTIQEIEFGEGELVLGSNWPIDLSERIEQLSAYSDGLGLVTDDGALHLLDFNTGALSTVDSIGSTDVFDVYVTEEPYILHATGNNGLKVYDAQLGLRSTWPPLGEARAVHSLDSSVYVAASETLSILDMDQTGVLEETLAIELNPTEKPTRIVVDRGFAYLIDSERGFFSIVDVLR